MKDDDEGRSVDLLGRVELQGGAAGRQRELFDRERYKTEREKVRINAENDLDGQEKIPF